MKSGWYVTWLKGGCQREVGRVENWASSMYSVIGKLVRSVMMARANVAADPVEMDAETGR